MKVLALTRRCPWCGAPGELTVDRAGMDRWKAGAMVQDALPDLDPALRDQLLSGLHPACGDALYGQEEG